MGPGMGCQVLQRRNHNPHSGLMLLAGPGWYGSSRVIESTPNGFQVWVGSTTGAITRDERNGFCKWITYTSCLREIKTWTHKMRFLYDRTVEKVADGVILHLRAPAVMDIAGVQHGEPRDGVELGCSSINSV